MWWWTGAFVFLGVGVFLSFIPCTAGRLVHTSTYGPREYLHGAVLRPHVDRTSTHVLSAVVHVQSCGAPWPLRLWAHDGTVSDVNFSPGSEDVLLYESASVAHGRPEPFQGSSYVNVFVHFSVAGWADIIAGGPTNG